MLAGRLTLHSNYSFLDGASDVDTRRAAVEQAWRHSRSPTECRTVWRVGGAAKERGSFRSRRSSSQNGHIVLIARTPGWKPLSDDLGGPAPGEKTKPRHVRALAENAAGLSRLTGCRMPVPARPGR